MSRAPSPLLYAGRARLRSATAAVVASAWRDPTRTRRGRVSARPVSQAATACRGRARRSRVRQGGTAPRRARRQRRSVCRATRATRVRPTRRRRRRCGARLGATRRVAARLAQMRGGDLSARRGAEHAACPAPRGSACAAWLRQHDSVQPRQPLADGASEPVHAVPLPASYQDEPEATPCERAKPVHATQASPSFHHPSTSRLHSTPINPARPTQTPTQSHATPAVASDQTSPHPILQVTSAQRARRSGWHRRALPALTPTCRRWTASPSAFDCRLASRVAVEGRPPCKLPAWHLLQHYAQRRVRSCPAGKRQPELNATACLACEPGRIACLARALLCLAQAGHTATRPTSGAPRSASQCSAGSFCPLGATAPTPCAAGSYAPSNRSERCTLCEAGSHQSAEGAVICVAAGWAASARWARASSCLPTASLAAMVTSRMRTACPTASTARWALRVPAAPRGQQHAAQALMPTPPAADECTSCPRRHAPASSQCDGMQPVRARAATARRVAARRCRARRGASAARSACMPVPSARCASRVSAVRHRAKSRRIVARARTTAS